LFNLANLPLFKAIADFTALMVLTNALYAALKFFKLSASSLFKATNPFSNLYYKF